ncbi:MAG TPA: hypothetical protein VJC16_04930 [Candidatus Nanoarchaeia archaeon]|nr:hypothetical protein [Candidatus Nanoarchaeia archaeon]
MPKREPSIRSEEFLETDILRDPGMRDAIRESDDAKKKGVKSWRLSI